MDTLPAWARDLLDTERVAHYTNLPPRSYTFRVIACNDDGVWNEKGASFAFSLEPRFYQMSWFHGLEGLAVFRSYTGLIELIITDLKMPVMDGYELIGRIRESRPGAKIICMSGYLEDDCPKGVKFLRKPFLPDDLRALVEEALS